MLNIKDFNKALATAKRSTEFRPKYHFTPTIGKLCEPCDIIYENKKYSIYFTINPQIEIFGPLYWGTAESYNFLSFRKEILCLAPDKIYDKENCKAGSIIKTEEGYRLFYTGVRNDDGEFIETTNLATSIDGLSFEKADNNPIIPEAPAELNTTSSYFRHPMVIKVKDVYIMAVASRIKNKPIIIFYRSLDGHEWSYMNYAYTHANCGTVWEYPNIYQVTDDKFALIFSAADAFSKNESYKNGRRVFYTIFPSSLICKGQKNILLKNLKLMDHGADFYGATVYNDGKNQYIVGLINSWGSCDVAAQLKLPYQGVLSIPRKLTFKNNRLYQEPLSSNVFNIKRRSTMQFFVTQTDSVIAEIAGNSQHFKIVFNIIPKTIYSLKAFKNGPYYLEITFNSKKNMWTIDRSHSRYQFINKEDNPNDVDIKTFFSKNIKIGDEVSLDVFLDVTTLEIFINNCEFSATYLYYSKDEDVDITLSSSKPSNARILVEHYK